jgi:hypothetical protein
MLTKKKEELPVAVVAISPAHMVMTNTDYYNGK